jgi:hypothetical protein
MTLSNYPIEGAVLTFEFQWHSISSFGPDQGTKCDWYGGYNCDGFIASKIGHPGISNMVSFGGNDQLGSFKCYTG